MNRNKLCLILLVTLLLLGINTQGQLPPPGPWLGQKIKQLVAFDQGNAIALLAGADLGTGKPTFFSVYFFNNKGELISTRFAASQYGEIQEIAVTGQGTETRLLALMDTKAILIFKVFPFDRNAPPSVATPERRLAETEGFTRVRATDTRVFAQAGKKRIGIFDVSGTKLQQLEFPDEVQDFLPNRNRLLAQTSKEIQLFDDQGKLLNKQALSAAISPRLIAFETGFAYQATEQSVQLLDVNGKTQGEVKIGDKISGLRGTPKHVAVQLKDQLQIFNAKGTKVAEFKAPGPIERLSSFQEIFCTQGRQELTELRLLGASDGRLIKTHQFNSKVENMEGFGMHLMLIVRDPEGRLFYGIMDESGNWVRYNLLPTVARRP